MKSKLKPTSLILTALLPALALADHEPIIHSKFIGDHYAPQGNHVIGADLPNIIQLQLISRENAETEVELAWALSNKNEFENILVYRNGLFHRRYARTTLDNNHFIDHNLNPDTNYTYQFRTESLTGVTSNLSAPITYHSQAFSKPLPRSLRAYTRSYDMSYINLNPYDCQPDESNTGLTELGELFYGQTHLYKPTPVGEYHTTAVDGSPLRKVKKGAFKTGITTGRPTMVEIQAIGEGSPNAVRLQAYFNGTLVGSVCMQPPEQLQPTYPKMVNKEGQRESEVNSQALKDVYHAYLMPEWVRPGLSLRVVTNGFSREVPADLIRIEPPTTYHLFDLNEEARGGFSHRPSNKNKLTRYYKTGIGEGFKTGYQWHNAHSSKDMLITTFPYVVEAQPYRISNSAISESGMRGSTVTYKDWGGMGSSGVSSIGQGIGSGYLAVAGHELGHATGLVHLEDGATYYPYGRKNINTSILPRFHEYKPMNFSSYHNKVQQYRKKRWDALFAYSDDYKQRIINNNLAKWAKWDYNIKVPEVYRAQAGRERGAYIRWHWEDKATGAGHYEVVPSQFNFDSMYPKQRNVNVIHYSGTYNELGSLANLKAKGTIDLSAIPEQVFAKQANKRSPVGNVDFYYRKRGDLGVLNHPLYLNAHYRYRDEGDATEDSFIDQIRENPGTLCSKGCNVLAIIDFEDGTQAHRLLPAPLNRIAPAGITYDEEKQKVKINRKPQKGGVATPYTFYFATLDHGSKVSSYRLCELPIRIENPVEGKKEKLATNIRNLTNEQVQTAYAQCQTFIEESDLTTEMLPDNEWNFASKISKFDKNFEAKTSTPEFRRKMLLPRLIKKPTESDFKHKIFQRSIDKSHLKPSYIAD